MDQSTTIPTENHWLFYFLKVINHFSKKQFLNLQTKALIGLKDRSDVGILYWNPSEVNDSRTEVF